ncbi:MAG TPA: trypsin-like peptidase domain-containing protein [Solirubrobacteraceae bacterium]|nr:trypsin-like peptidase domain-containing protein [Solirubrobacteraceae bacterium]
MTNSRSAWPIAIFSALLGGMIAVGLAAVLGVGGSDTTTTVVQASPLSNPRAASDGEETLAARDIYKRDAPGVVFIRANVTRQSSSPFGAPQQQEGQATGSGFVIDREGRILTNAHVVEGATKIKVTFQNDKSVEAEVLGADRSTDIALLKVDPEDLDLRPLGLGSSKDVQVGDPVVAIGNPFGLNRTLTTGVVSALQRQISGLNGFSIDNVIQTDAAINPGNSGGPLIDAAGEVIGINSQIETGGTGNGNVGIGFAVPIETARKLLPELEKGKVSTGYLGITGITIDDMLKGLNLPVKAGVLVDTVQPDSPALKAGIKGGEIPAQVDGQTVRLGGDIIVEVDGRAITTSQSLTSTIAEKRKGDDVKITVLRDGKKKTVSATLAERPQAAPGAPASPQP